ncbi:hypothetical protein SAMN00777080_4746 [Aquiflexum balticum DSM 16537]|uniref:DUF1574 domain-containing protein n=1 Tax=Aquiflexum balticum DSM 16537 TaxID=758820 RepID=A0A1W2HB22_9BACT|nr:hypothetical protein [Aquiflexum balticum]SMD46067.1 hypothetical protein SAMN00777080_4746 [Aquiflexum balticum DSM 16537]
MKKFIAKCLIFSIVLIFSFIGFFLFEQGDVDPFYQKLRGYEKSSLIIGTSKAAQGILPSVMDERLNLSESNSLHNFSFTVYHSPFGQTYLDRIREKLRGNDKGIFIVTVDPWSISSDWDTIQNKEIFQEKETFMGKLHSMNGWINLEYCLHYFSAQYIEILLKKFSTTNSKLHKDGWFEVNIAMDLDQVENRINDKVLEYDKLADSYRFSKIRFDYLVKTIEYLKSQGKVYLVRMPVHQRLLEIENELVPNFNNILNPVIQSNQIPYLDLTPKNHAYRYTDGNHLFKEDARTVSGQIAEWISATN